MVDIAGAATSLAQQFASSGKSGAEAPSENSNILMRNPNITALALAYAEHKINGDGIFAMAADWFTASDIAEGKATGLRGVFDKAWQAREAMQTTEKIVDKVAGPNHQFLGEVLGLVVAGLTYYEEGKMEDKINHKNKAPAPVNA